MDDIRILALGLLVAGCGHSVSPGDAAVVASYAGELAKCRASAKADSGTYAEYDSCAVKVDAKYGVKK